MMASDDQRRKMNVVDKSGSDSGHGELRRSDGFDGKYPNGNNGLPVFKMTVDEPKVKKVKEDNGVTNGGAILKLLDVEPEIHRKSCMEEESIRERLHSSLLKDCANIVRQEEQKYTRESLRRIFQDEVC